MGKARMDIATQDSKATVKGKKLADHFRDVTKMVDLGSGSQREIDDVIPLPKITKRDGQLFAGLGYGA